MMMAVDAFNKLEVTITIPYNNRKLLYGLLQTFEMPEEKMNRVILILDKMEKIDRATLVNELSELSLTKNTVEMNNYKLKDMDSGEEQLVNFMFKC